MSRPRDTAPPPRITRRSLLAALAGAALAEAGITPEREAAVLAAWHRR